MKISILIASRRKGNINSNLQRCIESLARNCSSLDNFEIRVKFDDDDIDVSFNIDDAIDYGAIITPRALGFEDLHKAYLDLLRICSPESELYWILSDDTEVLKKDWDMLLLSIARENRNRAFVINTSEDLNVMGKSQKDAMGVADGYPVWSRQWVGISGGFSYAWATDAWTALVCHEIEHRRKFTKEDYRFFCNVRVIRHCEEDGTLSPHFVEERQGAFNRMMDFCMSAQGQNLLRMRADSLEPFLGKAK